MKKICSVSISFYAILLIPVLLFPAMAHTQDADRGPRNLDFLQFEPGDEKSANQNIAYVGCGISCDEKTAMQDYQASHTSIRAMIASSGREYYIGTVGQVRPGSFGNFRLCPWRPQKGSGLYEGEWYLEGELDWESPEGEWGGCYYDDDPACDFRSSPSCQTLTQAECMELPFLDPEFADYQNLMGFDFNYTGTNSELEMQRVNRKKGSYYYGFADEIRSFGENYDMKFTGQMFVYQVPAWLVFTVMQEDSVNQPKALASYLLAHIDEMASHYAGQVDRWGVACEAVREGIPPLLLDESVSASKAYWLVEQGERGILGLSGEYPRALDIDGDSTIETLEILALVDDEIIRIDGRRTNDYPLVTLDVTRGYANTQAAAHPVNTPIYTIRNLLKPRTTSRFWPAEITDADQQRRFWLWHTITDLKVDPAHPTEPNYDLVNSRIYDVSDIFLVEAFKHARAADPAAKLLYNDYGCAFPTNGDEINEKNQKIVNLKAMLRLLDASGAPMDAFSPQMYMPVWACLTHDGTEMRLNPRQLNGIVESLSGFAHCIPGKTLKIATEIDIRMGITLEGHDEFNAMRSHVGTSWETAGLATRQNWQGEVYKAVFNAMLAAPEHYSTSFWGIQDEWSWLNWRNTSGWPWTPMIYDEVTYDSCDNPNPAASNPCILGAKPAWIPCSYSANCEDGCANEGEPLCEGEIEGEAGEDCCHNAYYLKPAYWGLREAIENYFGVAHVIRDNAGKELVRFVRNGNVLVLHGKTLLGEDIYGGIYENQGTAALDAISVDDSAYILLNSTCQKVAVITQTGALYLAGAVFDEQAALEAPTSGNALVIKNSDGEVVSMINEAGNLQATGTVMVQGVPYVLNEAHGDEAPEDEMDDYSTYQ